MQRHCGSSAARGFGLGMMVMDAMFMTNLSFWFNCCCIAPLFRQFIYDEIGLDTVARFDFYQYGISDLCCSNTYVHDHRLRSIKVVG